ncbi:MAG: hypothetical protein OQK82_07790 [Candidatus Pacearchaeota archaeon]|nr:hypothetical protein [Candidatus Pacearchaeota archaeon]
MTISIEELKDLLNVESGLEKISSVSSDGNNLLTRIPKEIREFL